MKPNFPFYYSRKDRWRSLCPPSKVDLSRIATLVSMTLRRLDELKLFPLKQRDFLTFSLPAISDLEAFVSKPRRCCHLARQ